MVPSIKEQKPADWVDLGLHLFSTSYELCCFEKDPTDNTFPKMGMMCPVGENRTSMDACHHATLELGSGSFPLGDMNADKRTVATDKGC